MSGGRGLPARSVRQASRVKARPAPKADPHGNRAQRRAWAKSNPAAPKSNQATRDAQDGPESAPPARTQTERPEPAASIPDDGDCPHCDGAGCVACDARHLPDTDRIAAPAAGEGAW